MASILIRDRNTYGHVPCPASASGRAMSGAVARVTDVFISSGEAGKGATLVAPYREQAHD
jgi:hypothetical protein